MNTYRTDMVIESLNEAIDYMNYSDREIANIKAKKARILAKQNEGYETLTFAGEIFDIADQVETKISGFQY